MGRTVLVTRLAGAGEGFVVMEQWRRGSQAEETEFALADGEEFGVAGDRETEKREDGRG